MSETATLLFGLDGYGVLDVRLQAGQAPLPAPQLHPPPPTRAGP
jgi:hypothetical protein